MSSVGEWHMFENMETPAKLANSVINDFRQGSESVLNACSKIAWAWQAVEIDGPWSEDKFVNFIDRLAEANIGPGSSVFYVDTKKETAVFTKSSKAGAYYQMKLVGECPLFKSKDFRSINRITSYSVLYRLSVYHNQIYSNSSGSENSRIEKADKAAFGLLKKFGSDLTRDDINKAISKINKRKSRAPIEDQSINEDVASISHTTSLENLISNENQYDLIFMTPNEEILSDAADYSLSTLMDKAPYEQLMKEKSKTILIGKGRYLEGLKKLAQISGGLDKTYCVRNSKDKSSIIDLSNELIIITNINLDLNDGPKGNEKPEDFVNRTIFEREAKGKKLHLFADIPKDGWDTVDTKSSFLEI